MPKGYNAKNYMKQGGNELVIGGKLLPATEVQAATIAVIDAAAGATPSKAEYDVLVAAFNALVAANKGVGIVAAS